MDPKCGSCTRYVPRDLTSGDGKCIAPRSMAYEYVPYATTRADKCAIACVMYRPDPNYHDAETLLEEKMRPSSYQE